jgi:hypothetical protein
LQGKLASLASVADLVHAEEVKGSGADGKSTHVVRDLLSLEANLVAHGLGKAFQHSAMVIQHAENFSHLCLDAREPLGSFAFKLKVATLKLQVLTLKLDVSSVSFRHPSQKRRLVFEPAWPSLRQGGRGRFQADSF